MRSVDVAIVGAGFAGLGAVIRLQQAGRRDVVVLEKGDSLGGTWRDNTYPGAACDVPSHLYSFSFALKPDWRNVYAKQTEIREYLEAVADRFGVRDRIRLGVGVAEARWEGEAWVLTLSTGETLRARAVIFGVGALRDPRIPDLPGLERFEGAAMHSARWDHRVSLAGKRVAVIGTGASAIQIVPEVAKQAAMVHVVQRTPPWVQARRDRAYSAAEKATLRVMPGAMKAARLRRWAVSELRYPLFFGRLHRFGRLGEWWLGRQAAAQVGPALAHAVRPSYRLGCKRILLSDDWYPALRQPHVRLHTAAVTEVQADGVSLADGERVPVDVIIWCTGFLVDRPMGALRVIGRGGADLAQVWGHRPRAYLGITVPGFPNAFVLLGPNTALGHSSVVIMIEAQLRYVLGALRHLDRHPGPLEVREEALAAFVAEMDARHARRVWATGCSSWYLSQGENFTIWPGSTLRYIARTARFDPSVYR